MAAKEMSIDTNSVITGLTVHLDAFHVCPWVVKPCSNVFPVLAFSPQAYEFYLQVLDHVEKGLVITHGFTLPG